MSDSSQSAAEKRARLAQLLHQKANQPHTAPLHPAQRRLWIHYQLQPESPAYHVVRAWRLRGALNVAALQTAVSTIVSRHAPLRTTFTTDDAGRPLQVIAPSLSIPITQIELPDLAAKACRPFDLATGPLARFTLVRRTDDEAIFMTTMHHIIADGWSMRLFFRELGHLYAAAVDGRTPTLPPLKTTYPAIAQAEAGTQINTNKHRSSSVITPIRERSSKTDDDLAYWRQKLNDLTQLNMPTDRPRPPLESFRGQTLPFVLPPPLAAQLNAFSRQERVTLFTTILAAFKLLLYRYTGQDDIVIGTPVANRQHPDSHDLIGCFVNTLPLRTQVDPRRTFREWLHLVRTTMIEAQAHHTLPFDQVVEALQPTRDPGRQPFFQHLFAWQGLPGSDTPAMPGLDIAPYPVAMQTAKFDLTLLMWPTTDALAGEIEYNTDLYDETTIKRLVDHLQMIFTVVAANPDSRLPDIPMLTAAERRQLLVEWCGGTADFPVQTLIHHHVEAQAARHPDKIALQFADNRMTYRELNGRANQLAHILRRSGVGPGVLVGMVMGRSLEMVIGILGALKAGGAYVPIDTTYPQERLAFILADTQAPVVLTKQESLDDLRLEIDGLDVTPQLICVDADEIAAESKENPSVSMTPDSLAYVIYTSGSTGYPKGVLVTHQNVVRLMQATQERFHFGAEDVWTLFHSYAFDFSVWELWGALFYGGRLVIVPYWISRSPDAFYDLLVQEGVTVLNQTPSAFRQLIQADERRPGPQNLALRWVIFGGEALELQSLQPWFDRHGDQKPRLVNMYGITETTVHVTYRPLTAVDLETSSASVIGRPIPDLTLTILDIHGQPVPVGVPGEIYVGGAGVARGYLNRPGLTAEKFIPNPFVSGGAGEQGSRGALPPHPFTPSSLRLYKTGDLARYLPNGDIEYLGRIDQQVKIRGFRIELGEIEAALGRHTAVREAVVLAREAAPGDKRLVAYLVAQAPSPSTGELREFLRLMLPDYMIPAAFVMLDALPLTNNGKVDRRALPPPVALRPELTGSFMAPRHPIERKLAHIWAGVLGVAQIGIYDNFFELGGDSILSIQIVSRANQAGLPLHTRHLFQHQTVAELAQVVARDEAMTVQAEQGLATGPVPLTPIQHWFFDQNFTRPEHWNMPVWLKLRQSLDSVRLEQAWAYVWAHHDALRARFQPGGSGWQQMIKMPGHSAAVTRIDLSDMPIQEQQTAMEAAAATAKLDFSGSLCRILWFDGGTAQPGYVLIILHHLLVDGVSWRILVADLTAVYTQLMQDEPVALPLKTTSYQTWAHRLTEYARSSQLMAELHYWLGLPWEDAGRLPVDHGGANLVASVDTVSLSLTAAETTALLQEVPATFGTQVNDVLLTALAQTLAGWMGTKTILVDVEGHGREPLFEDVDLSRTVGWFTTIFPVVLHLGADTAVANLHSIQSQLNQIPQHGIGYGLLRYLCPDDDVARKLSTLPQAAVSFNYLGRFDAHLPEVTPFQMEGISGQEAFAAEGERPYLLQVSGLVMDGRLQMKWHYSQNVHKRATIQDVAVTFRQHLRALIREAQINEQPKTYPLGPMQQEIFNYALSHPESDAFFVQWQARLDGELDGEAFAAAWAHLLARHEMLRMCFRREDVGMAVPTGTAVQEVGEHFDLPWQKLDWRHLSVAEQERELNAFLLADRQQGFRLEEPILHRFVLIRLARQSYRFVWSHHHLLLDGWSMAPLWRTLLAVYERLGKGDSLPAPAPAASGFHQRYLPWLQNQDMPAAERVWRRELAGVMPTPLPLNREQRGEYAEQVVSVDEATTAVLQTLAQQNRLTLNTLVQGAWAFVLQQFGGTDEVVFGIVNAGRPPTIPGIESMWGMFVNVLPLRVNVGTAVSPKSSLLPWLQEIQTRGSDLRQYSYCSPSQIQAWSGVRPLFDSFLRFQNYPMKQYLEMWSGPFTVSDIRWYDRWHYPLNVIAVPGSQLTLKLGYDSAQLDGKTAVQMLSQFQATLNRMAESGPGKF